MKFKVLLPYMNALLLSFSFLISKILGLVRDNLLASEFGAQQGTGIYNLDTYYAAFRLPDFLFNLLSYGVLSAAFIPLFIEITKKENKGAAFRFANEILYALGLIVLAASLVLFIGAPYIVDYFVPGFSAEEVALTVELTRIMLLTPIFFTVGSIAGGIQNAEHKFMGLALAPVMYNVGIIAGILLLSKEYGVYGVAIGVSAGAFLNMVVQLPSIFKLGFRLHTKVSFWNARIKEMLLLSLPRVFGMSVTQLALIINTIIASTLANGSITVMNFATNIQTLPIGLVGISVAVVSFGTLSSYSAEGKMVEFAAELSKNLQRILFLLIPMCVGLFVLRFEIIQLLLTRGQFTLQDAQITAETLGILLIGLVFGGIVFILARGFYALKDTRTPVIVGVVALAINIFVSILLTRVYPLGTYGLAYANVASDFVNALLLVVLLQQKVPGRIINSVEVVRYVASALAMFGALTVIKSAFSLGLIGEVITLTLIGAAIYFIVCYVLGSPEVHLLLARVRAVIKRS